MANFGQSMQFNWLGPFLVLGLAFLCICHLELIVFVIVAVNYSPAVLDKQFPAVLSIAYSLCTHYFS